MRYLSPALVLMGALMLQAPAAHAIPMTFVANLTQANEVPPTGSPATGLATVILDPTAQTIQINATFSGLTSNDIMAHIRHHGAHPLLPGFSLFGRCERRSRHYGSCVSWVPFGSDLRDLLLRRL